ncbi:MAG: hypothetical protein ABI837_19165, partial [Acidobacteriota bacterium]
MPDRLFDSDSSVIEVYALLFASAQALRDTPFAAVLNEACEGLAPLCHLRDSRGREDALVATNNLRIVLVEALPFRATAGWKLRPAG